MIEAALAANGYIIEVPLQRSVGGPTAMVMSSGLASVLFVQPPGSETLEIEVWGVGQPLVERLFKSLPLRLHRQEQLSALAR
jgi:hypothetical protein